MRGSGTANGGTRTCILRPVARLTITDDNYNTCDTGDEDPRPDSVRIGCLDVLDKDSLEVDSEHSK